MALSGKVIDLSGDGWGVVRHDDGKTFFVHGAWPGDEVEFEPHQPNKKYSEASLVKVLVPSSDRREKIPCIYQGHSLGQCGGCPWMMVTYPAQLKFKQRGLEYLIDKHQLRIERTEFLPIIGSPREFGFRNRAQFKTNGLKLGFVSPGTNMLVDVGSCQTLNEPMQENLKTLRSQLPNKEWYPKPPHGWNFIESDDDQKSGFEINQRRPFKQGNDEANLAMKEWLSAQLTGLDRKSNFLELYAGSGNFTSVLLGAGFKKITAVEISSSALEALAQKGVQTISSDLSDVLRFQGFTRKHAPRPRYLLLDPPREGALGLEELVQASPELEKIFYISCDSRTWVRDVQRLAPDFAVTQVQPLDQFPHTPHLEILSVLERIS